MCRKRERGREREGERGREREGGLILAASRPAEIARLEFLCERPVVAVVPEGRKEGRIWTLSGSRERAKGQGVEMSANSISAQIAKSSTPLTLHGR